MATLFHFPLDPFGRRIRLSLAEYGCDVELEEVAAWEHAAIVDELFPPADLPALFDGRSVIGGVHPIAEYLEETAGANGVSLLGRTPAERAEARRLAAWFDQHFHAEVSGPLLAEKVIRRFLAKDAGGGPPDMGRVRASLARIRDHLTVVGMLADQRNWLAGRNLSIADLAAAAHLSVVDYLGDVPWHDNDAARQWYQRIKSRPSFRPLLADYIRGLAPPRQYADLDF